MTQEPATSETEKENSETPTTETQESESPKTETSSEQNSESQAENSETTLDQEKGQDKPIEEKSAKELSDIKFNIKDAKITDPAEIEKLDLFFRGEFFIPDFEGNDTFDQEELLEGNYTKSAEAIGDQINPIAVAVCYDDPTLAEAQPTYNPESRFRVHGRIADGRHRYLESKALGKNWRHEYYVVRNFEEFMVLRSHMDVKKKQSGNEMINKFQQICEYYHQEKGVPKPEVCAIVVKNYSPPYPKSSLRHWILDEYKDQDMADRKKGKGKKPEETKVGQEVAKKMEKKAERKLSKKDATIDQLRKELSGSVEENTKLTEQNKVLEESVKEYDDLKPFLSTKQDVVIEGTDMKVSVEIDLEARNFILKKV